MELAIVSILGCAILAKFLGLWGMIALSVFCYSIVKTIKLLSWLRLQLIHRSGRHR